MNILVDFHLITMKKIAYLIIGRSLRFEKTEKNKKKYDNKYKI